MRGRWREVDVAIGMRGSAGVMIACGKVRLF